MFAQVLCGFCVRSQMTLNDIDVDLNHNNQAFTVQYFAVCVAEQY